MKKLHRNSRGYVSLIANTIGPDPTGQVPLSEAIRSDYDPVQYRKLAPNSEQSATDEGLKRQRQQQHKSWLDKLNEPSR